MAEEAAAAAAAAAETAGESVPEPLIVPQAHGLGHLTLGHPGGRGGSLWLSDSGVFQPWSRRKGHKGHGRGGRRGDYLGPACAF